MRSGSGSEIALFLFWAMGRRPELRHAVPDASRGTSARSAPRNFMPGMRAALASTARFASQRAGRPEVRLGKQRGGMPQQPQPSQQARAESSSGEPSSEWLHSEERTSYLAQQERIALIAFVVSAPIAYGAFWYAGVFDEFKETKLKSAGGLGKDVPPIVEEIRRVKQRERDADAGLEPS